MHSKGRRKLTLPFIRQRRVAERVHSGVYYGAYFHQSLQLLLTIDTEKQKNQTIKEYGNRVKYKQEQTSLLCSIDCTGFTILLKNYD